MFGGALLEGIVFTLQKDQSSLVASYYPEIPASLLDKKAKDDYVLIWYFELYVLIWYFQLYSCHPSFLFRSRNYCSLLLCI